MVSPLSENITTMVKSRATSVMGEIRGMKTFRYHSSPFSARSPKRLAIPAMNGMPR